MFFFQGCATTKGCFGIEENCVASGNCPVMVTYKYLGNDRTFEIVINGKNVAQVTNKQTNKNILVKV